MGFLERIVKRATPENPRFSLYDPNAWDAFGADPASSGIRVSAENALTYSPWWRAITLISSDVGKLPLSIKKRRPDGGKDDDPKHAGHYLLLYEPNEYQTALTFRQQITGHALTRGNGYAYINRRGDGSPFELIPMNPEQCWPVRETNFEKRQTRIWYVIEIDGTQRKLDPSNVLHIHGFGFDGIQGANVVDRARESLGCHMATARYASIFFRNAGTPRIVLEVPGTLDEKAKDTLRKSWERMHTGVDNSHRTAILDRGLTAKPISFNAQDTQLIESRKFGPMDVSNFTGVPPHKLGDREQAAYNSLESENQSYLDGCLDYWLVNWETQCRRRLLTEDEKRADTHVVSFDRRQLIRANLAARGSYFVQALQNGWLNRDEVRDEEGWNPIPDDEGKKFLVATNMGGSPKPGEEPKPAPEEKPPDKKKQKEKKAALLADVTRRMVRRVNTHALRAAKDRKAFGAFVEGWAAEHGPMIREAFAPVEDVLEVQPGADTLILELRQHWSTLADEATAWNLEELATALAARLETELPLAAANLLGD